jgi:hypothetical protein
VHLGHFGVGAMASITMQLRNATPFFLNFSVDEGDAVPTLVQFVSTPFTAFLGG